MAWRSRLPFAASIGTTHPIPLASAAPNDAHNCTPSLSILPRCAGAKYPHFQLRFASSERNRGQTTVSC